MANTHWRAHLSNTNQSIQSPHTVPLLSGSYHPKSRHWTTRDLPVAHSQLKLLKLSNHQSVCLSYPASLRLSHEYHDERLSPELSSPSSCLSPNPAASLCGPAWHSVPPVSWKLLSKNFMTVIIISACLATPDDNKSRVHLPTASNSTKIRVQPARHTECDK